MEQVDVHEGKNVVLYIKQNIIFLILFIAFNFYGITPSVSFFIIFVFFRNFHPYIVSLFGFYQNSYIAI